MTLRPFRRERASAKHCQTWEMVARDGIEPPTPAFSGPRSTTELSGLGVCCASAVPRCGQARAIAALRSWQSFLVRNSRTGAGRRPKSPIANAELSIATGHGIGQTPPANQLRSTSPLPANPHLWKRSVCASLHTIVPAQLWPGLDSTTSLGSSLFGES